jgi:hypothetical protein
MRHASRGITSALAMPQRGHVMMDCSSVNVLRSEKAT